MLPVRANFFEFLRTGHLATSPSGRGRGTLQRIAQPMWFQDRRPPSSAEPNKDLGEQLLGAQVFPAVHGGSDIRVAREMKSAALAICKLLFWDGDGGSAFHAS